MDTNSTTAFFSTNHKWKLRVMSSSSDHISSHWLHRLSVQVNQTEAVFRLLQIRSRSVHIIIIFFCDQVGFLCPYITNLSEWVAVATTQASGDEAFQHIPSSHLPNKEAASSLLSTDSHFLCVADVLLAFCDSGFDVIVSHWVIYLNPFWAATVSDWDASVEIWFDSHFKLPPNVVWISFTEIQFHVDFCCPDFLKSIWIFQKSDLGSQSEQSLTSHSKNTRFRLILLRLI